MSRNLYFYISLTAITIISLLFLTGCPGASDYDIDLPDNYSIVRTSANEVTIAPKTSKDSWGSTIIPAKVTEVGWDDQYIIAKQINIDSESSNGSGIPDEQEYHFWIIQIKTGEVTGPLDDLSLTKKKEEYRISNDIVLKKIEDLKKNYTY
ncbi:hypothetical protein CYL18_18785 [Pradoshia eiseniae]|uniref:DUF3997 domain-containing protein n=1 Tax=Pradoshia eiseniae TaxID=2064768 RepID=A0A2S7MV38_9BACI|nr:DUF3997 domain-containing protein [Pradoshia eiseniae]PQD93653.1 hypothetical protein CYL18_18785 [Pradoshia eiseniae]